MKGAFIFAGVCWVVFAIIVAVNGHDSTKWSLGIKLLGTLSIVSTIVGLALIAERRTGTKIRPWMIALGLGVTVMVFNLLAFGEEAGHWPPLAVLLFVALLPSPIYMHAWDISRRQRRVHDEWLEDLADAQPSFTPTPRPSAASDIPWVLGGALLPAAPTVYGLIRGDVPVTVAMVLIGVASPMLGALGYEFSPRARYDRRIGRLFDELDRKLERSERRLERKKREELELTWQARLKDALYWWNTHGARLNGDDHAAAMQYLEDHVRVTGPGLLAKKDAVLRAFNDENDPCATAASADEMSRWAVANKAELLKDRLERESDRTAEGLAYILRAHHRRDFLILSEAEPALFAHAAKSTPRLRRDESPEDLYRRLASECESLLEFKAREMKHIEDLADELPPDQRAEWKRTRIELLLLVIMHEMRRRMEAAH